MSIRLKIVAFGLGLGAVAITALAVVSRPFPSDESFRARFFSHRADFERLVAMSNEDSHLTRIAPDYTWLDNDVAWPRKNVGISEQRWDEYKQLFQEVGASKGIIRATNPARIIFPIVSIGLVPTSVEKGLVFSDAPLSPVLKFLDKRPPDKLFDGPDHNHVLVYKPIEDHWYIYYEEW